jgi:hypothetical protein
VLVSRSMLRLSLVTVSLLAIAVAALSVPRGPVTEAVSYRLPLGDGYRYRLVAHDLKTNVIAQLVPAISEGYSWNSDGSALAYLTRADRDSDAHLMVRRGRAAAQTLYTDLTFSLTNVHWLPDDRHLMVRYAPSTIRVTDAETGASDMHVIDQLLYANPYYIQWLGPWRFLTKGDHLESIASTYLEVDMERDEASIAMDVLTCENVNPVELTISPDGTRWLYLCPRSDELRIASADAPDESVVVPVNRSESPVGLRWSPDGGRVMFMLFSYAPYEIFLVTVDLNDGTRTTTRIVGDASLVEWLPPEVFRAG